MFRDFAQAGRNEDYRPYKGKGAPNYPGLGDILIDAPRHPDPRIAYAMAVLSAYAYAGYGQRGDAETVSMIMTRMGLEQNRCSLFEQRVDAMYIASCAYLVQSEDGRVVILCYRGTQPEDVISVMTDADVVPEQIEVELDGEEHRVHGGFYRNMRVTRYLVIEALRLAVEGYSIEPVKEPAKAPPRVRKPLEALYITGHSLGGAMAALMGVILVNEPAYERIAAKLRAIYTFGQPMLGDPAFADACERNDVLRDNLIRYIYDRDVVPHLPSRPVGPYAPFGREFQYERDLGVVEDALAVVGEAADQLASIPGDLLRAARNPLITAGVLGDMRGDALDLAGGVLDGFTRAAGDIPRAISDPQTAAADAAHWIKRRLVGGSGRWKERMGNARSEQIQNLSGLNVAAAAFLAKRLELARSVPFKYSFDDHIPNHYISALATKGVRSEFGDVR
jgi:hypothetical protein